MSYREDLNVILINIGQATLSDVEFSDITLPETPERLDLYIALIDVLKSRSVIDDSLERLKAYALAVDDISLDIESEKEAVLQESSNVFLGSEL